METWCRLDHQREVNPGGFSEARVVTQSGVPLHAEEQFLDAFALRIMNRYESQPLDEPMEIPVEYLETPDRTKHFYRRLFDEQGAHTQAFITEASETLALWIEERLDNVLFAQGGVPHNSDPAYDVLAIVENDPHPRLRVVQVKATEGNLQGNCNEALVKFERLERGDYDAELSASIDLLVGQRRAPEGVIARELKVNRLYRVTVVHTESRDALQIMTTFDQKVRGNVERRSARLVEIVWADFWVTISLRVYAQLS